MGGTITTKTTVPQTQIKSQINNEKINEIKQQIINTYNEIQEMDNKINKNEQFIFHDNGYFRGKIINSSRQDIGEFISENEQNYYFGKWDNNKLQGLGFKLYVREDYFEYYIGNFQDDIACGEGKLVIKDGSNYYGSWKNDLMDGDGILNMENVYFYKGKFKEGKMHGEGVMRLIDKTMIKGVFQNGDLIYGSICYINEQNNTKQFYTGELRNGKFNGKGQFIWENGSYYDGNFVNQKREGLAYFKNNNTEQQLTKWEDDKLIGE